MMMKWQKWTKSRMTWTHKAVKDAYFGPQDGAGGKDDIFFTWSSSNPGRFYVGSQPDKTKKKTYT